MHINREIPAPIQEDEALSFWARATTTCQLTAVQILDDMVAVNFQADQQNDIPVPVLTWYFWNRSSTLVQAEQAMSDGAGMRDLSAATQMAQDIKKQLDWLATAERADAREMNALRGLYKDLTDALAARPYHPKIADQTYGGNVPEPRRIQLVAANG